MRTGRGMAAHGGGGVAVSREGSVAVGARGQPVSIMPTVAQDPVAVAMAVLLGRAALLGQREGNQHANLQQAEERQVAQARLAAGFAPEVELRPRPVASTPVTQQLSLAL